MKSVFWNPANSFALSRLLCAAALFIFATISFGAAPAGSFNLDLTERSSLLDLSGTHQRIFSAEGLKFTLDWTANVDAAGKINGTSSVVILGLTTGEKRVDLDADPVLSGTVSQSGSVLRTTLHFKFSGKGFIGGQSASYKLALAYVGDLNTEKWEMIGDFTGSVSANGSMGSLSAKLPKTAVTLDLPEPFLKVGLTEIKTDAKGKLTGKGTLQVSAERQINGAVSGNYDAKTGVSTLNLAGTKPNNSEGANLNITGILFGEVDLHQFSGKVLGQTLKLGIPKISKQPAGLKANVEGSAIIRVTATGMGTLGYQWRKGGEAMSGATNAVLVLENVKPADAGDYAVVVSNGDGSGKLVSSVAVLTVVVAPPVIEIQPLGATVKVGTEANFRVTAKGYELSYQWRKNGVSIAGATNMTMTLIGVKEADVGSYTVTVSNVGGSRTSNAAKLALALLPVIRMQPKDASVIAGNKVTLEVTAAGTAPLSYQWQKDNSDIAGATKAALAFSLVQKADAGNYTVVVSNLAGSVNSRVAKLDVSIQPPAITRQPADAKAEVGDAVIISVTATGSAPLAYQWRKLAETNWVELVGATSATLTLSNVQTNFSGSYSVVISNSATNVTSREAKLSVIIAPPRITAQPVKAEVIEGTTATFTVTATGTPPLSYQWSWNATSITNATNATLALLDVPIDYAGYYSVVVTNITGRVPSQYAQLVVKPMVAWGNNYHKQITLPAGLSGVTAIAAGYYHSAALKKDGTVLAWGQNDRGQTSIPTGLTGVIAIACGERHSVALKSDGSVVAWGDKDSAQITVPAGLSGVTAIAAGQFHTVALKGDGTVIAWGDNGSNQSTVPAGLTGVKAIAAGGSHTLALKNDGTVVAWGSNGSGQTDVQIGLSGIAAIAAGNDHTVVLKNDGTVLAWGLNATTPIGLNGVKSIAAGGGHTVILKTDGTVLAWGRNDFGQTTVPAGLTGIKFIAAGFNHTLAR